MVLWCYKVVSFFLLLQTEAAGVELLAEMRGCIGTVLVVLSGRLVILL